MPTGNLNAKLHVRWTRPGTIHLWAFAGRHRGSLNASRAKFRLVPQSLCEQGLREVSRPVNFQPGRTCTRRLQFF